MNYKSITADVHTCKNHVLSAYSAVVTLLSAGDMIMSKTNIVLKDTNGVLYKENTSLFFNRSQHHKDISSP